MNISKFLLIDASLAIAVIPLLFLIQGGKGKSPLFRSSNKEDLLRKTSIKLPEKEKLIAIVNKQIISGVFLFVGILLLVARRNVTSAARRILFGSSIGFFIIVSIQVKLYFIENIIIYWPIFIIFSVLCILSFYVSYLKKY